MVEKLLARRPPYGAESLKNGFENLTLSLQQLARIQERIFKFKSANGQRQLSVHPARRKVM